MKFIWQVDVAELWEDFLVSGDWEET